MWTHSAPGWTESRRAADGSLHHLVTGYSVGRIGEWEVSAWELGTGSAFVSPTLGIMNLIALSTGLVLEPGRMWRAFRRGWTSRNLYPPAARADLDSGRWPDLTTLRKELLEVKAPGIRVTVRALEFTLYSTAAMLIHAVIAIPAVIARSSRISRLGTASFRP